jgi:DNA-binding NtrC family response regulator
MKSWVASAFSADDFSAKKEPKKKTSSTKTNNNLNDITNSNKLAKPSSYSVAATSSSNAFCKSNISLSEKYKPKTRNDLVVNKSKVEQLSQLIDTSMQKKKGSVLIVEGPSGCGKYVGFLIFFY